MLRRDILGVFWKHTRAIVKAPVNLPGRGSVFIQVNKDGFVQMLMREYGHDEETGLTAEYNPLQGAIFIQEVSQP